VRKWTTSATTIKQSAATHNATTPSIPIHTSDFGRGGRMRIGGTGAALLARPRCIG